MKFLLLALVALTAHAADPLPAGPGKAVLLKVCSDCHGPEVITGMGHDRDGWKEIVDEMVDKGAVATPAQLKEIIDYLQKAFPKKPR